MSIIAWDGTIIAADKAAHNADCLFKTTKLRWHRGTQGVVLGWTGGRDSGELLAEWYEAGADPAKWPEVQKTDDWARLIVAMPEGIWTYERQPIAVKVEDARCAWGSGRDFALGALWRGGDAIDAVQAACHFSTTCGLGIDWFNLKDGTSGVIPLG